MSRFVDCSHVVADGQETYPDLPAPKIRPYMTFEDSHAHYAAGTEFQVGEITMVANTGTYLDTPAHRWRDGHDLADLPLTRCADLPGRCVDLVGPALQAVDLRGLDVTGCAVLVRTGWSRHAGTARYGDGDHPYVSGAAAESLAAAGAALVGIDSVNIDDTADPERPAHTALLAAGIPIVEHLTNLAELPPHGFRFFAVPAKVAGLATFPVRAFAIVGR